MNEERKNALFLYATECIYSSNWTASEYANQRRQVRRDIKGGFFFVQDGMLFKKVTITEDEVQIEEKKRVIGASELSDILNRYHCVDGNHVGIRATLAKIHLWYWWPTIRQDISKHIASCEECQEKKPPPPRIIPIEPIIDTRKNQRWQIDFKGPLAGNSENKWFYLLFVIDHFDKFSWSKVFQTKDPEPVIEYVRSLFATFENPSIL